MSAIVVDLASWRDQALEAIGAAQGITFRPNPLGEAFTVPHPLLLTDAQSELLPVESRKGNLAVAKLLLGEDVFARFQAAGGRAGDVLIAWRMMGDGVELDPNSLAHSASLSVLPDSSSATSSASTPASDAPSPNGGAPLSVAPTS